MTIEYDDCLKRGKIKVFSRGPALSGKEIEASESDLVRAHKTHSEADYKWATIQIYYSMFHSARALLYARSLREHSHYCLVAAIKILYVDTKIIPVYILEGFQQAKTLREEADYYNRWSQAGCEKLIKLAEEFLEIAKNTVLPK
ncbi:MAG: HEPN domain-containing protein [Candidatus Omnitrophica bacterium]|nr:HEPN domain-containing protein [Candidatus Omnitrophota bacterium]